VRSILLVTLGAHAVIAGWIGAARLDGAVQPSAIGETEGIPAEVAGPRLAAAAMSVPTIEGPAVDPDLMGRFLMTRYYIAEEFGRVAPPPDPSSDADPMILASALSTGVTIYDHRGCRPIATLAPKYVELLDVEGTGKLRDGRIINVTKPCSCGHSPCYRQVPGGVKWGISATMRPLQPFRTISVDPAVIKLGSMVYVAELDGLTMPGKAPWGGFVHDGCVIAADVGGAIDGAQIDFFVGKVAYKQALDARKKMRHVTVYDGAKRCAESRHWVAPRIGS